MKITEFNQIMRPLINKKTKRLDINKIAELDDETKENCLKFIVRNRGPIVIQFVNKLTDMNWLDSCGYLYKTQGKLFTFIHTSEHEIK